MAGYFQCGFARVAVKLSYGDNGKPVMNKQTRYENYIAHFGGTCDESFKIGNNSFNARSPNLLKAIKNWKAVEKEKYMKHFSSAAWSKLSASQRPFHTIKNCKACQVYHQSFQSLFPIRCNRFKNKTIEDIVTRNIQKEKVLKPTQASINERATNLCGQINEEWKKLYNINFEESLAKAPKINLEMKKSKQEKKKESRHRSMENKRVIQEHWAEMDVTTFLGTRQSFSQRDLQRQALFFESRGDAVNRTNKRKALEEAGQRAQKRHSPDPEAVQFDKAGLLEEVNKMKDGDKVIKNKFQIILYKIFHTPVENCKYR